MGQIANILEDTVQLNCTLITGQAPSSERSLNERRLKLIGCIWGYGKELHVWGACLRTPWHRFLSNGVKPSGGCISRVLYFYTHPSLPKNSAQGVHSSYTVPAVHQLPKELITDLPSTRAHHCQIPHVSWDYLHLYCQICSSATVSFIIFVTSFANSNAKSGFLSAQEPISSYYEQQ